jgi:hypothetical protein
MNDPDDFDDTDEISEDDLPWQYETGEWQEEEVEKISFDKLRNQMRTW